MYLKGFLSSKRCYSLLHPIKTFTPRLNELAFAAAPSHTAPTHSGCVSPGLNKIAFGGITWQYTAMVRPPVSMGLVTYLGRCLSTDAPHPPEAVTASSAGVDEDWKLKHALIASITFFLGLAWHLGRQLVWPTARGAPVVVPRTGGTRISRGDFAICTSSDCLRCLPSCNSLSSTQGGTGNRY